MKTTIPLIIVLVGGIIGIIFQFIPHEFVQTINDEILNYFRVLSFFALPLGIVSILMVHTGKIRRKAQHWQYSIILILTIFFMIVTGFVFGTDRFDPRLANYGWNTIFMFMFQQVQIPIESTMFSLLAFYISTAAYRAFRARSKEATILLVASLIVMLGQVSVGQMIPIIGDYIPVISNWIMSNPNMAAKRGILLGVALGMLGTSLKIILGIERAYLGRA
ncbi:MAG: hypothetical protein JXA60_07250 [Candidatus Coatesbacteria bacterium]|nr:hypothetical protein [Candidatus Coatesbacteria bacterium]